MVQNNKVLTVSYGTFSCTLEGFEDSFGTMKAIAEYFRDLASDDRYFGAEPPQPDADMLARIAQREIARQVEARTSDGGIHLRAAEAAATVTSAQQQHAAVSTDPSPQDDSTSSAEPHAEPDMASEDQPTATALVEKTEADTGADTTDREAEVTAAAAEATSPPPQPDASSPSTVATEQDAPTPDATKIAAISAAATNATHAAETPSDGEEKSEAEEEALPDAAEIAVEDVSLQTPSDEPPSSAESIAAKLRRIRAVVSKSSGDDYSEDEHAESILPEAASNITDAIATDAPTEENAETGFLQAGDTAAEKDDEIDRVLSQLSAEGKAQDETPTPEDAVQTVEPAATPRAPAPRRARVIKVKRAEVPEAVSAGMPTPAAPAPTPETPADENRSDSRAESSLSEEDEEDLMRELAAVEAELLAASEDDTPGETQDDAASQNEAAAKEELRVTPAAEPTTPSRQAPNVAESDVSRLMDAADAKLDAPETTSSRETYNHLRAAVAAAKADPASGGTAGSEDSEGAYREDLASVVTPRRPTGGAVQPLRKSNPVARPAPLKLVAEQRIDPAEQTSAPAEKAAVRPRRISVLADDGGAKPSAEGGFAAYAQKYGAIELRDLLEAAAAYMSFVEGREHFSRPQLLNAVRKSGKAEFKREDGLRTFGQLLREGKIERSENGRFVATEDIGFQPAKRAAG